PVHLLTLNGCLKSFAFVHVFLPGVSCSAQNSFRAAAKAPPPAQRAPIIPPLTENGSGGGATESEVVTFCSLRRPRGGDRAASRCACGGAYRAWPAPSQASRRRPPACCGEPGSSAPPAPPRRTRGAQRRCAAAARSEEHTSELQSREKLVCRLL